MTVLRRLLTLSVLLVAAACDATLDTTTPSTRQISPGTYTLSSVNGHIVPFRDPQTLMWWTGGEWVVAADKSFSATFNVSTGSIPRSLSQTGTFEVASDNTMTIDYSDGTRQLAVLTPYGFRAGLGSLTLGLSR
jgi:hypothetical protein